MKIRLNENEVYEIKLPEEIDSSELPMIASRFNVLLKSFNRFISLSDENSQSAKGILMGGKSVRILKKFNKSQWRLLRDNRKIFLELLNTYYNGTNEEFESVVAKYNFNFGRKEMSCSQMIRLRELHKVKPNEVGLTKFPNKIERVRDLRIQK